MTLDQTFVQQALQYARRGWAVFPLVPKTKRPITEHGLNDATTDPATIRRWWAAWPDANIGINCGASGLVVVDVDTKNGAPGMDTWQGLLPQIGGQIDTPTVQTPTGGYHYYYAAPPGVDLSQGNGKLGPGVDVKGNGGYVVAPPSVHPDTGTAYQWFDGYSLDDREILPLPAYFVRVLQRKQAPTSTRLENRDVFALARDIVEAGKALQRLAPWRCEEYGAWVDVGMALSELGAAGFELWDKWSQRSAKYDPEVCAAKWESFEPGNGITLASLFHWAKEDTLKRQATKQQPQETTEPDYLADAPEMEDTPPTQSARVLSGLPEIVVTDKALRDQTGETLAILQQANDPAALFVRSGGLARITKDEHGLPIIDTLSEAALRGRMARVADFVRVGIKGDRRHVAPPLDVVRDIMALGEWPFPRLAGIIESPTIKPNGDVITRPGYDQDTGLFYVPAPGLSVPDIPENPTQADIVAARKLACEPLIDFPFEDRASAANALAAMFTAVLRPMIGGPVPLALFDKPQAGTGASLLAEVVARIATGRPSAMMTAPSDDESWRKGITALLMRGATIITIDNIEGRLFAPSLAAALTSSVWQDRILGRSETIAIPQRATWIATGNNIKLAGDLPRRCYWVRMDAGQARPWQRNREDFLHPDLIGWVCKERGAILASILTIARAWMLAGSPVADELPAMGGFEAWATVIGSILDFIGVKGFCDNLSGMYDQADEETPQWEAFFEAWREKWADQAVTTKDVAKAAQEDEAIAQVIPDFLGDVTDKGFTRRLGNHLAKREGMAFSNGLSVHKAGAKQRALAWVVKTSDGQSRKSEFSEFSEFISPKSQTLFSEDKKDACTVAETNSYNSPNSQDHSPEPVIKVATEQVNVSAGRLQELMDQGYSKAEAITLAKGETPQPNGGKVIL